MPQNRPQKKRHHPPRHTGLARVFLKWRVLVGVPREKLVPTRASVCWAVGVLDLFRCGNRSLREGLKFGLFLSPEDVGVPLPCPFGFWPLPWSFLPVGGQVRRDWAICEIQFCMAVIDCKSRFSIPWFQPLPPPFRETICHTYPRTNLFSEKLWEHNFEEMLEGLLPNNSSEGTPTQSRR